MVGKTYVDLLQDLMEKTITLALATGHKRFSASLSKLVENYAELLASQEVCFSESAAAGSSASDTNASYVVNQLSYTTPDPSQNVYQVPQPYSVPSNTYSEVYQQQPTAAYGYNNTYQPQQPTHMFVPPSTPAIPQVIFSIHCQLLVLLQCHSKTVKTFTPANPTGLKNPEQYQQANTLGSQLYTGSANQPYSSGPAAPYLSGPPTTYHQPRSPAQYQTAAPVPPFGAGASVPGTVLLTTSDWDECNFWLAALKRMIKTRQNFRIGFAGTEVLSCFFVLAKLVGECGGVLSWVL
ncbi:hypothetical protein PR202_gb29688 [Eleusine coracana subsp. coracana]|uniref:Uncharacterized protein n=1 Tax=Eleusine coracana subsp. coracana TaxID=191504 RepID=A0AAV5FZY5_ELECO|nr:hypothetical protein PR202_gb29688 [Eleusine coracana subsp. coracana]